MPSMRCLMTAGEALKKENVAGYNCSYVKVDSPRSFDEILYVLMNGTGVGFSVEDEFVNQMSPIAEEFHRNRYNHCRCRFQTWMGKSTQRTLQFTLDRSDS